MKDEDNKLIYEALHSSLGDHFTSFLRGKENPEAINSVTCFCDDCEHWSAGNKCVAESIELTWGEDTSGNRTCECQTYNPVERE